MGALYHLTMSREIAKDHAKDVVAQGARIFFLCANMHAFRLDHARSKHINQWAMP